MSDNITPVAVSRMARSDGLFMSRIAMTMPTTLPNWMPVPVTFPMLARLAVPPAASLGECQHPAVVAAGFEPRREFRTALPSEVKAYRNEFSRYATLDMAYLEGYRQPNASHSCLYLLNHTSNPKAHVKRSLKSGNYYRVRKQLTSHDMTQHLSGQRAIGLINRPDRRAAIYGLDYDAVEGTDYAVGSAWAIDRFSGEFPGVPCFVQPSRSYPKKGGFHLFFKVWWPMSNRGAVGRENEQALFRSLKDRMGEPPVGWSSDMMGGGAWYDESNPKFSPALASAPCDAEFRKTPVVGLPWPLINEIGEGRHVDTGTALALIDALRSEIQTADEAYDSWCWITVRQADQYVRQGKLAREVLNGCDHGERIATMSEVYDLSKTFYGIRNQTNTAPRHVDRSVKFTPDPRLEQTTRHGGRNIVAPGYGILCNDSPNCMADLMAFMKCLGSIRGRQLTKLIGGKKSPAIEEADVSDGADDQESYPSSSDMRILAHEEDHVLRMAAAARMALRQSKGDIDQAAQVAEGLLASHGLQVGTSQSLVTETAIRRAVQYASRTYDAAGEGTQPKCIWFDDDDIAEMERLLGSELTGPVYKACNRKFPGGRLKVERLAVMSCFIIKNILVTKKHGNKGAVSTVSIERGLKKFNIGSNGSILRAGFGVLQHIGFIVCLQEGYSGGQCRIYALGPRLPWLAWMGKNRPVAPPQPQPAFDISTVVMLHQPVVVG